MNIEIRGVEFNNKGAELMLHAVLEELGRSCPETVVAMDSRRGSFLNRARLGLYQKPMRSEWKLGSAFIERFWREKTLERYGILPASRIDVILDASGFAYSDQFKPKITVNLAKRVRRWKKAGKKIVLLPQAMGPFETKMTGEAIRSVADHADLIFPRDRDSYDYVVRWTGERDNIRLRPDFTNLVKGKVPDYFNPGHRRACLIPNSRMIHKTSESVRSLYIPFLVDCSRFLSDAGLNPFILVHEAKSDAGLAREIREKSGLALEIIEESDPINIKGIIGGSSLVVGSRYHGLVSSLSQGVPALATGWSHKYQRLYEEYACQELLISKLDFESQALPRLQRLVNEDSRNEIADGLLEMAALQVDRSKLMWREVRDVICPGAVNTT